MTGISVTGASVAAIVFLEPDFLSALQFGLYLWMGLYLLAYGVGALAPRAVAPDGTVLPEGVQHRPRARVLVVDDDPALAAALRDMVRLDGHTCLIAGSSEEASTLCRRNRFDLMFIDALPGGAIGLDVAQGMVEGSADLRPRHVILLTDAAGAEARTALLDRAIDGFLVKPPTRLGVQRALARCLRDSPEAPEA